MEAILIVSIFILCFSNETFEVLASSTDNKPEGFNKVYDGKITEAGWAEFTAELPAGTPLIPLLLMVLLRENSSLVLALSMLLVKNLSLLS